jgi:two-component system cell cycle sensor histidine kinase/response regulator CckA
MSGGEQRKRFDGQAPSEAAFPDRKQFERALQESEERFRRLAEASYEGIAIIDGERVVDANPQAAALLGYELSEYIGKSVFALLPPEDQATVAQHMRSEDQRPWEGFALHKDGSKVLVEVRARVVHASDRSLRVVVFRDVGERRAIEQRLRDTEKMQVIGRLAGSVAHDFNNLLTVILGCAHLLERNLASEPSRSLATEIAAAADRAAALTRQLLSFSRRQVLDLRVLDLNDVIRGMSQMLERLLGEGVSISTRLDPKMAPIRADVCQLEQILMNLCTNGRDAMPEGGEISIVTETVVVSSAGGPAPAGRWAHLVVADQGAGMDAATLSRVFEPLFTTKDVGRGTGLGLSTVHSIVGQSGGRISIASELDRGTTVHVWLPALEEGEVVSARTPPTTAGPRGTEAILLVEDDTSVRSLVNSVLRSLGYSVIAATPSEAERVARTHLGPIDLLVSDVVMPGIGGPAVASLVRAGRPNVRVLYISGYSDELVNSRLKGAAFLPKPFTPSELGRKVREVLDAGPSRTPVPSASPHEAP